MVYKSLPEGKKTPFVYNIGLKKVKFKTDWVNPIGTEIISILYLSLNVHFL